MSARRPANVETFGEPSWMTAVSETDAVVRRLSQATASVGSLSMELAALREWSHETARLDLARALTDGPDGGVLSVLVTLACDEESDPGLRRAAGGLLDRLTSALGLEPIVERGEHLRLLPEERGEFEIRGAPQGVMAEGTRQLFRVIRPGWWLGAHIVERPLLEPVAEDTTQLAPSHVAPDSPGRRDA